MSKKPVLAACVLPLLLLIGASAARAQVAGRAAVTIPEVTEDGDFEGTWWYVNRDVRAGMWIRRVDGKIETRLQFLRFGHRETFSTDWQGQAEYSAHQGDGTFSLTIEEQNANEMKGTWLWELVFSDSKRREESNVRLYRAGDGRRLVVHFLDYRQTIYRHADTDAASVEQIWTFRQASKRLLVWDELPF